jgi:hypothetical protein
MDKHPLSGLHYIHVMNNDNLTFSEVYDCYQYAAQSLKWMSTRTVKQYYDDIKNKNSPYYEDEHCMYILWHDVKCPEEGRKARCAIHYSEQIGDLSNIFDAQRTMFTRFVERINQYDLIFVHTRFAAEHMKQHTSKVHFVPIGYEKDVMGEPDYKIKKKIEIMFYGSHRENTKRAWVLQALSKHLKKKFRYMGGAFKRHRKSILDKTKLSLYIPHEDNCSFATMRLWHTIASSAVMLIEPTDTWPAQPEQHYIEIPTIKPDNMAEIVGKINVAANRPDLLDIARRAHDELSKFDVKYCMEEFLIPASKEIMS